MIMMFKKLFGLVQKANTQSKAAKSLYSMTDSQLRDIGLTRGDVAGVVNGTITTATLTKTF